MRTRWTLRAFVTATAIVVQTVALAPAYSGPGEPEEPVGLLDVPFVPQSGVLCGGAAVAMVLRYWGERAVLAEDFGPLVRPGEPGIRTEDLVEAVRARGWTALPFTGSPADMRRHLAQGRPVIALFQEAPGSFHYVVLVSWARGGVILHDPAVGPFRVRREAEFDAAWSKRGRWALLILPPQQGTSPAGETLAAERSETSQPKFSDCDSLVEQGIRLARGGDTAGAEARLLAARSLCPTSAAPLRELAGLRFRAEDWPGAARLAELAAERDPADADTWRLLAGSRYLAGDVAGALEAWNEIAEPRADVARIDGLVRIHYGAVAGQLDLPPGQLLTSGAYQRARRRLDELPARSESRITLRPLAEGSAQVNVAMLERPLLFGGKWDVGAAGLHALAEREIALNVASPTGHGELWTAAWRFQEERPRIALGLAAPAPALRPGIWHVNGSWERQAYQVSTDVVREERRRAALAFSDWAGADVRLELGVALDRWKERDTDLSLAAAIETRRAGDRLALGAGVAGWANLDGGAPFQAGSLWARWTTPATARDVWRARAGVTHATAHAPFALWPGAGTGLGRDELLRAHPLLTDGVVTGPAFGRTLVHAGIERQQWAWTIAPVRAGWALFVDSAKPFDTLDSAPVPWNVDAGAGLRLAGLGGRGQFRLDVARGLVDPRWALSLGWESR